MSVDRLNAALAAALGDLREPHKSGKADTGQYGYTYLTLDALSDVVRAAFKAHGLAFTQHPTISDSWVTVTTRLVHESGATWRTEPLSMPVAKGTPQGIGSVITYCRRYQLAALVGLSGSDDDDAAGSTLEPPTEEPRATAKRPTRKPKNAPDPPRSGSSVGPPPPTPKQDRYLDNLLLAQGFNSDDSKHAQASAILGREVESMTSLTMSEASQMIDALQQPKAERVGAGPDGEPPEDPYQGVLS